MSLEVFLAALGFAFITTGTPGPNTIMLLASGVNFGFRRTLPHVAGVVLGFISLLAAVGFGLGALFEVAPAAKTVLKVVGSAYLVYLAYRIATSSSIGRADGASGKPLTLIEASLFQCVNPKAWMMAISAMSIYTSLTAPVVSVLFVLCAFSIAGICCSLAWAGFGTGLRGWLSDPKRLRVFNAVMGILLLLTVVFVAVS